MNYNEESYRGRLSSGNPAVAAWFALGSVALVEVAAAQGAKLFILDCQHGLWDRTQVRSAVNLMTDETQLFVRVSENNAFAIGDALDAGANGVIVPLVETAEGAAHAVSASRFPPVGIRSGGGVRPLISGFANYVAGKGKWPAVGVMIETKLGLENAASIAAVPGLDFVFIGSGDLALSLGSFPCDGAELEESCLAILMACRAAGMPCGLYTSSTSAALAAIQTGYHMIVGSNDLAISVAGYRAAHAELERA